MAFDPIQGWLSAGIGNGSQPQTSMPSMPGWMPPQYGPGQLGPAQTAQPQQLGGVGSNAPGMVDPSTLHPLIQQLLGQMNGAAGGQFGSPQGAGFNGPAQQAFPAMQRMLGGMGGGAMLGAGGPRRGPMPPTSLASILAARGGV